MLVGGIAGGRVCQPRQLAERLAEAAAIELKAASKTARVTPRGGLELRPKFLLIKD